jgi:hypothetical protein
VSTVPTAATDHQGEVEPLVGVGEPDPGTDRRPHRGELAPEPGQSGQAERRDRHVGEQHAVARQQLEHPAADRGDVAGVVALVQRPGEEEQHAGDDAVREVAEQRRLDARRVHRRDAEHHEAHVADRGEGDQPLHVGLGEAAQRAVDDADDGEHPDERGEPGRALRQDRQRDADEAVGPHLQQHAGQQDRPDRGCLGVRVGQPGVERPHRHLDREPEEDAEERPGLEGRAAERRQRGQLGDRPGLRARLEVDRQEGDQHEHRAEQRVEEELHARVVAPRATPDPDHEEHRDEHELPEDEEQDQVEGDERAGHARLQHQHQRQERLRLARRWQDLERVDRAQQRQQVGEEEQRQRDAVDREEEARVDRRDPRHVGDELQLTRPAEVEGGGDGDTSANDTPVMSTAARRIC